MGYVCMYVWYVCMCRIERTMGMRKSVKPAASRGCQRYFSISTSYMPHGRRSLMLRSSPRRLKYSRLYVPPSAKWRGILPSSSIICAIWSSSEKREHEKINQVFPQCQIKTFYLKLQWRPSTLKIISLRITGSTFPHEEIGKNKIPFFPFDFVFPIFSLNFYMEVFFNKLQFNSHSTKILDLDFRFLRKKVFFSKFHEKSFFEKPKIIPIRIKSMKNNMNSINLGRFWTVMIHRRSFSPALIKRGQFTTYHVNSRRQSAVRIGNHPWLIRMP